MDVQEIGILSVLQETFGYSHFRPLQEEIIEYALSGKDALVIMPTGGGKSLCYQIPGIVMEGITIVVSPLIALMNDQVIALKQLGVKASAIHSNLDSAELKQIVSRIENGDIKILYVSPERMNNTRFIEFLKTLNIGLFAIDEAHCVSIWGNDFRPDYANLSFLKSTFSGIPMVALTATADAATQQDIVQQLKMEDPRIYLSSFERDNITLTARAGYDRKGQIIQFLDQHQGHSGIIYCLSRKSTEKVCKDLINNGIKAAYYHAGMEAVMRNRVQERFQNDEVQIVCATIAFGMGIDKSNINWIIHYNMPKNLEGYYQEIGRSGRDGSPSETLLFYSWADFLQLKRFIDDSEANENFKYVQTAKLNRMWEFSTTTDCRTNVILTYFGEFKTKPCGHCDNCLFPPEKFDGLTIAQKAISAVIRSKEKLNINLLIDVLRGSYRQEVKMGNFHQIKTFGAGRDLPFNDWKHYITQVIDKGLLKIDYVDKLRLKLTPLSASIVKGNTPVLLSKYVVPSPVKGKKKLSKKKTATEVIKEELLQELKSWRLKKSNEKGFPAYVILTDHTIQQIASVLPTNRGDLWSVEGMGAKRMKDYGEEILLLVQEYIRTQPHKKNIKGRSLLESLRLYKEGLSPSEIAEKRSINELTVYSHLSELYLLGEDVDIYKYVNSQEINVVRNALKETNGEMGLSVLADNIKIPMAFYKIRLALAILQKKDGLSDGDMQ